MNKYLLEIGVEELPYKFVPSAISQLKTLWTNFLNDNYWPMIMGQFGIIGAVLVIIILILLYKEMIKLTKNNMYHYFSTLCLMGILLISSIALLSFAI